MELELHFIVAENGDEQTKTHAGRQKKAKKPDYRHIVPVGGNA